GDDVLQRFVGLQYALYVARNGVVLLADDARIEHTRGRVERVDGRVDAELGNLPRQHRRRVEMGKRRGRRRVGQVVGRHVDRLHRGDRALLRAGDAFFQGSEIGRQGPLVADRRGDAAQERRDFRTGLGESEDVVDEEQDVLTFLVAEIFGEGKAGEADAGARP